MRKQTIIDNCNRLLIFLQEAYREDGTRLGINGDECTAKDLIKVYGRYLDYNGLPKSGLSRIVLEDEEYTEMVAWAKSDPECSVYWESNGEPQKRDIEGTEVTILRRAAIGFFSHFYQWAIYKTIQP